MGNPQPNRETVSMLRWAVISPAAELFLRVPRDDSFSWRDPHACKFKIKKTITIKPSIQIKFGLHHCFSYGEIFQTRPQLPLFA